MAEELKILGQEKPPADTLTDVYEVPAGKQASVSSFVVCNLSDTVATFFRVSVAKAGEADDPKQYLYRDLPIPVSDSFAGTIGITLGAGDVLRFESGSGDLAINVFGVEVSP